MAPSSILTSNSLTSSLLLEVSQLPSFTY
jgi:hypothetical protein